MISTTPSSPARERFARARAILSGLSSSVVTWPPVERAASASQMVEKALEVPTSRIRVAEVARTMIESRRPVSRVILSIRLGRAVSRESLSSPNVARVSSKPRSASSTQSSLAAQRATPLSAPGWALAAGVGVVAGEHARVDHAHLAVHDRAEPVLHRGGELVGLGHRANALCALSDRHQRQVHVGIADALADPLVLDRRSEERRVGKECRSRWSPDH